MIAWQATDISSVPASYQMAPLSRETFEWTAPMALTAVTAALIDMATGLAVVGPIESITIGTTTIANDTGLVTVSGLTIDVTYVLVVMFTNAAGRRWPKTLVLPCRVT